MRCIISDGGDRNGHLVFSRWPCYVLAMKVTCLFDQFSKKTTGSHAGTPTENPLSNGALSNGTDIAQNSGHEVK